MFKKRLKKGFFFIGVFFFLLLNLRQSVFAVCQLPTAIGSNCEAATTDCNNNLGTIDGNNPGYCTTLNPQSCYVLISYGGGYQTVCFGLLGVLSPTPAPCGGLNWVCCLNQPVCNQGLVPQSTTVGNCFCVNPASPIPTNLPIPTGNPTQFMPTFIPTPLSQTKIDVHGGCVGDRINTALGCIPANDLNKFIKWVLSKVIFVASGIAFLLMALGALMVLTSAGVPEKAKAGSELITSALSGLLFVLLSVFLLKLIGVDILQIPGFGK